MAASIDVRMHAIVSEKGVVDGAARRFSKKLGGVVAILVTLIVCTAVRADTLVVTNATDVVNGDTSTPAALQANPGPDGISLREAMFACDNTPGPHTITFSPSMAGRTIPLGSELRFSQPGTTIAGLVGANGFPSVTLDASAVLPPDVVHIAASGITLQSLAITGAANIYIVIIEAGNVFEPQSLSNVVVSGCSFVAGANDGTPGVVVGCGTDNSGASVSTVTITGSTFTGFTGDAIMVNGGSGSSATVQNVQILNNYFNNNEFPIEVGEGDGATNCTVDGTVISQNTFVGNFYPINLNIASDVGSPAPIGNIVSNTSIARNVFRNNTWGAVAIGDGGNVAVGNQITNTEIVGNLMTGQATGNAAINLNVQGASSSNNAISGVDVANNTIAFNDSYNGGGIQGGVSGPGNSISGVTVANNIFFQNPSGDIWALVPLANVTYNIVWDGEYTNINNNFSAVPEFVDPTSGNCQLMAGSPAINAGNPAVAQGTDLLGTAPYNGDIDLGAFNYNPGISPLAVAGLSPNAGGSVGGTVVTLTGQSLGAATAVYFGAVPAPSFVINSATSITAVAPPESDGTVEVVVIAPSGTSAAISSNTYTYTDAPVILTQPAAVNSITYGQPATFTVAAAGSGSLSYQWQVSTDSGGTFSDLADGNGISGSSTTSLTLSGPNVAESQAEYRVVVTSNNLGLSSNASALVVSPAAATVTLGSLNPTYTGQALAATAVTNPAGLNVHITYSGTGGTAYGPSATAPAGIGSYSVVALVDDPNYTGSATGTLTIGPIPSRLVNLSARAFVNTGDNVLIAGFGINGTGNKQLLLRGVGPGMYATFTVPDYLNDASLSLYDNGQQTGEAGIGAKVISTNNGWQNSPVAGISPEIPQVTSNGASAGIMNTLGAFSYAANSLDASLLVTVPVSSFTAQVSGLGASPTGVALAEIYDADTGSPAARLINISARAQVGTGFNILIAGFVVQGNTNENLLIRGVGPGLTSTFQLTGTMTNPQLQLYDDGLQTGENNVPRVIATVTNWGTTPTLGNSPVVAGIFPATAQEMTVVGAFSLTVGSTDAAMYVTVPPGHYTAQLSGVGGTTGIGMVEVYEEH